MWLDGYDSMPEACKIHFRPLWLAMQADNRAWPGGVTDAFRALDWPPVKTLAQMSPDDYNNVLCVYRFLLWLEYSRPRRVLHEIAALGGCITVPDFKSRAAYPSRQAAADALAVPLRHVLYSLDLASGTPTLAQRQAMQADLLQLISAAHAMYLKLNG